MSLAEALPSIVSQPRRDDQSSSRHRSEQPTMHLAQLDKDEEISQLQRRIVQLESQI